MTSPLDDDVVTALHYDDVSLVGDLVAWCGGGLEATADGEAPAIWVPTVKGPSRAELGDWIVRRPAGDYYTCDATTFAALHTPFT